MSRLALIGLSHKNASRELRERMAVVPAEKVFEVLKSEGVEEAVVLSTCNRFEVYVVDSRERAHGWKDSVLGRAAGADVAGQTYSLVDAAAVEHLLSVSAGLDSLVVGETEVLGQVKTAYESAFAAGMTGKRFNVLFQRALFTGKKARTETAIAVGQTSVASVAVQLASTIFGTLSKSEALILGAGAMAEMTAKHMLSQKVSRLVIANRTWERGKALADRLGARAVAWDEVGRQLETVDIVISSTGSELPVLGREMVAAAMAKRAGRSLFLIDIAMPRDVEEGVHGMEHVYVYRLEDLQAIVDENLRTRGNEIEKARALVKAKAEELWAWCQSLLTGQEKSLKHAVKVLACALLLAAPSSAAEYGILLLAHGGDKNWNAVVEQLRAGLDAQAPAETALGMADHGSMQAAVDRLAKRGAKKIAAVPLFIHSRSEVLDQTRFMLGLADKPSAVFREAMTAMARAHAGHHAGHRMSYSEEKVKLPAPLAMAPALDDSAAVTQIVTERARALSKAPAAETLILVGHGPVDQAANDAWLKTMSAHAAKAGRALSLRAAEAHTIRDDAPAAVRAAAIAELRRSVQKAGEGGGRALVVPYLIARGGIERKISGALEGLPHAWDGRTLCPDPAIEKLLALRAAEAAKPAK